MTYDPEADPEVVADMQLRESSKYDGTRTRLDPGAYQRPALVDAWRCRVHGCLMVVPVTAEVAEHLAVFNAQLARKGDAHGDTSPIDRREVMICARHQAIFARERRDSLRPMYGKLAEAIRVIKASKHPNDEHEAIRICKECHHLDLKGLLLSVEARRSKETASGSKPKGGM